MGKPWRERIIDAFSQKVYDLVIPKDHFLRRVNEEVDFSFINPLCESKYKQGKAGRRAEAPERLFRALFIMIRYAIPFETCLTREIALNLAYRWFCGLGIGEPVFDHSLFYVLRKRLGVEWFEQILTRIVEQCFEHNLIGNAWAFYDTTDIEAAATRYSPYERAVIIARAVIRLLEQHPAEAGDDPSQPPNQVSPALRRLVAEIAQEVAGAKERAREPIVRKVEQLTQQATTAAEVTAALLTPQAATSAPGVAAPALMPQAVPIAEVSAEPLTLPTAAPPAESTAASLPHLERAALALAEQQPVPVKPEPQALQAALIQLHDAMPRTRGDADARLGHTSKGEMFCGYWSGNIVDGKYGVITATHLEQGNCYAPSGLVDSKVAEQHVERVGAPPQQAALDAAFDHPDVREHLAQKWSCTTTFIHPAPLPKPASGILGLEAFTLTETNELRCSYPSLKPEDRVMKLVRCDAEGTHHYVGQHCAQCPVRARCTTKANGRRTVALNPEMHRQRLTNALLAQLEDHRSAMKKRFAYAEAPYGHGKRFHRWGKAPYRSWIMNKIFNLLVVIVHNIEKSVRYAPIERRKRLALA
jgi:transposase